MTGAAAARTLAEAGARVAVIDAHEHVGGNCYDVCDAHGVLVHPYGPHIFHTSRQEVVDFLSPFTLWRPYEHRVVALIQNRLVPLPFNLTSIAMLFGGAAGQQLVQRLVEVFGYGAHVPILQLRTAVHSEFADLAAFVYAQVFEGYTRKQWGLPPDGIDAAITGRVPVRVSHDDRYFTDSFQCMPAHGFTPMFTSLLQHENITLHTGTTFADVGSSIRWKQCIYTGPVDEFFAGCHGWLPYRSLDVVFEHYAQEQHLPVGVVNCPAVTVPFTRISEYRHLTGQRSVTGMEPLGTTVSLEYPRAHEVGKTLPYYPVLTEASMALLRTYQAQAHRETPRIVFAGRLGAFTYINMDDAVLAGLAAARHCMV